MKFKDKLPAVAGFTVLEVLVTVVVVTILATVSMIVTRDVTTRVRQEKLSQDVRSMNIAVQIFESSGGGMNLLSNPSAVVIALKSSEFDTMDDLAPGMTGRLVHQKLKPIMMTGAEVASGAPRAIWNNTKKRFDLATTGGTPATAVKQFTTDESGFWDKILNNYYGSAHRHRTERTLEYASTSDWVWQYGTEGESTSSEPTKIVLNPGMTPTNSGVPPGMSQLAPPTYSIPGGLYPLGDYDKTLTLSNPNSPVVSEILYSITLGSWVYYDGSPITVPAGTTVTAFARSLDSVNWVDSVYADESYTTSPVLLAISVAAPSSMDYFEAGGALMPGSPAAAAPLTATVTLDNPSDVPSEFMNNDAWNAYWTYNGTSPLEVGDETIDENAGGGGPAWLFSGPDFSVSFPPVDVPLGLGEWGAQTSMTVKVAAVSQNQENIVNSTLSTDTITIDAVALRPPQVSTGGGQVTITPVVAYGDMPAGARIYYTEDGSDPGDDGNGNPVTGTLYSAPFTIAGNPCVGLTVMARIYPPSPYEHWFDVSANTSVSIPIAPSPNTPQALAYGFENSSIANYAVLALEDGNLETNGSAQVWGNLGIGPGNKSALNPINISGEYHVDPTYESDKDNVYDIATSNPIAPTVTDLAQAEADAFSLSGMATGLTATQTFGKIDNNTTISATNPDGFNVIDVEEINLSGETLTLSGTAEDWFILTLSKKLVMNNSLIALTGGVSAAHVLFNMEAGTDPVEIKGTSNFIGTLLSPDTQVKILQDAVFQGVIVSGKDTQLKDNAIIQAAGNGFSCEGAGQAVTGSGGGTQLELGFSAPASINYFEAGGSAMPGGTPDAPVGPAIITLTNAADIDDAYENSGIFRVYWTEDGTDPSDVNNIARNTGDPFGGGFPGQEIDLGLTGWGTEYTKDLEIAALSFDTDKVTDSAVTSHSVARNRVSLRAPTVTENAGTVTIDLVTSFGDMPAGARIYYHTDGRYPGNVSGEPESGTLYTGPFALTASDSNACGEFIIVARVYAPSGYNGWFVTSPSANLVVELNVEPPPGTAKRFIYNYGASTLTDYAAVALRKLETNKLAKVFGNIAIGPGATRKMNPLALGGNYDADPTSVIDTENVSAIEGGAPVSPNSVDLSQTATDATSLAAEMAALTPTQTIAKIETTQTLTSTAPDGINVIQVGELVLKNERKLTLSASEQDYFLINVTSKLEFDDGTLGLIGGIQPSHVIVQLISGVGDVQLKGDGNFSATLIATNSKIEIKEDVSVDGSVLLAGNKDLKIVDDANVGGTVGAFAVDCTNGSGGNPLPPGALSVPLFSILGAEYPANDYPLSLTLSNPNEAGSSTIQFSVNGGGFSEYTGGPISVAADDTVQAYCAAIDSGQYSDSSTASHTYTAGANTLVAPAISPTADKFTVGPPDNVITVTITNPNPPALGTLKYRVDGGAWTTYSGPFNLFATSYTSNTAIIDAKVVSTDVNWLDSDVVHEYLESTAPVPLDKPLMELTPEITAGPDGTTVTITNPNPPGTSDIQFVLVPIPSALGCDIIHGIAPPPGTWMTYTGPLEVPDSAYPNGFAVISYSRGLAPGYVDSETVVGYDTNDTIGLRGGHFDVDSTGRLKYPGVWANFPGGGSTDKHTHEYDNKFDTVIVDLFDMGGRNHATVDDSVNPGELFKITIVNANLSPMAHVAVNEDASYSAPYVFSYDDIPFANLPVYSIDGIPGTVKLEKLSIVFDEDAIVNAGLTPSNTGDVKGNTPGKAGEWRNGALTLQVVKVTPGGVPVGAPLDASKSNGDHGVGDGNSVLYEVTIFWHWPGDSYHDPGNPYVPMDQSTILSGLDDSEEPVCP